MTVKVKTVFTALSFAAAAAAATSFNFQILATSGANSSGLEFAELAPPAPTVSVVESVGGIKTIIAYVTQTAEGKVVIQTLPAVTVTAEASSPGIPTNAGGATASSTGSTAGTTQSATPTASPTPTLTVVSTPVPTLTDAPAPTMTQARVASKTAPAPSATSDDDDDDDDDDDSRAKPRDDD